MDKAKLISDSFIKINNILSIIQIGQKYFLYNKETNKISIPYYICSILTENFIALGNENNIDLVNGLGEIVHTIDRLNSIYYDYETANKISSMVAYEDIADNVGVKYWSSSEFWGCDIYEQGSTMLHCQVYLGGAVTLLFSTETKRLIHTSVGSVNIKAESKNYMLVQSADASARNILGTKCDIYSKNGEFVCNCRGIKSKVINHDMDCWIIDGSVSKIVDNKIIDTVNKDRIDKEFVELLNMNYVVAYSNYKSYNLYNNTQIYEYSKATIFSTNGDTIYTDSTAVDISANMFTIVSGINTDGEYEVSIDSMMLQGVIENGIKSFKLKDACKIYLMNDGKELLVEVNTFEYIKICNGKMERLKKWDATKVAKIKKEAIWEKI